MCMGKHVAGPLLGAKIMHEANISPLALRPRDAAKALGISTRTLYTLTKEGAIPAKKIGHGKRSAVLYSVADLQAFLKGDKREGGGANE